MKTTRRPAPKFDAAPWLMLDTAKGVTGRARRDALEAVAAKARALNLSPRDHEAFWRQYNDAAEV